MKVLNCLFFLFLPFICFTQDKQHNTKTDSLVLAIDKRPDSIFSITKTVRTSNNQTIVYKYQFKKKNGSAYYIRRELRYKDSLIVQVFYSVGSSLIFSSESITNYYGKDSTGWGGTYYFSNGKLKDYTTFGHGKSEFDDWNPEVEVLSNYRLSCVFIATETRKR